MNTQKAPVDTIDAYIQGFPEEVRALLERVRRTIRDAAPDAREAISYRIPTFKLNGKYLIYFAGFETHIGLYPVPVDTPEFKDELAIYGSGKATLKFPLKQPIPYELITRVVKAKLKQYEPPAAMPAKRRARP